MPFLIGGGTDMTAYTAMRIVVSPSQNCGVPPKPPAKPQVRGGGKHLTHPPTDIWDRTVSQGVATVKRVLNCPQDPPVGGRLEQFQEGSIYVIVDVSPV